MLESQRFWNLSVGGLGPFGSQLVQQVTHLLKTKSSFFFFKGNPPTKFWEPPRKNWQTLFSLKGLWPAATSRSRPVRAPVPSIWCSCDRPKAAVFLFPQVGSITLVRQNLFYQGCKCWKSPKPCHEFRISRTLQHEFRCRCLRIRKSTASRWWFWLITLECIHPPGFDCNISRLGDLRQSFTFRMTHDLS